MTGDKVAGDGPYKVERHAFGGVGIVGPNRDGSYTGLDRYQSEERVCYLNEGYAAGRKAERERCAMIAETEIVEHQDGEESYLCGTGKLIADNIRGGQDGE